MSATYQETAPLPDAPRGRGSVLDWLLSEAEHSASRRFMISGAVWLAIATLGGLFTAIQLFAPDALADIAVLEFGRVRQLHTNLVVLAFVGMMTIGAGLYIVSVMLAVRLFSERLANLAMWLYNLAVSVGVTGFLFGYSQAREYAEMNWFSDVFLTASLVILFYVLTMTVLHRKEPLLYVAVWYVVGAILWTGIFYPVGNVIWRPPAGALTGTVDAVWLWFYGHNIFGLYITPLATAILYYMMPRIARRPLYSHTLSLIGFWSLLAFYAHIGAHHLLQAPIPLWLRTLSVVDSVAMILPVATVLVNLWFTTKDNLGAFARSVPGKYIYAGAVWYLIVCLQGPLQSLPEIQRWTHFNQWVIGHSHISVLGFTGLIAVGGLWYLLPAVTGRRVYSMNLANLQFWLMFLGVSAFFAILTIAGLVQGSMWVNGETVYRTLLVMSPYMGLRLATGILIIAGAWIGLYNLYMSLRYGERIVPEQVEVEQSA